MRQPGQQRKSSASRSRPARLALTWSPICLPPVRRSLFCPAAFSPGVPNAAARRDNRVFWLPRLFKPAFYGITRIRKHGTAQKVRKIILRDQPTTIRDSDKAANSVCHSAFYMEEQASASPGTLGRHPSRANEAVTVRRIRREIAYQPSRSLREHV